MNDSTWGISQGGGTHDFLAGSHGWCVQWACKTTHATATRIQFRVGGRDRSGTPGPPHPGGGSFLWQKIDWMEGSLIGHGPFPVFHTSELGHPQFPKSKRMALVQLTRHDVVGSVGSDICDMGGGGFPWFPPDPPTASHPT